MKWHRYIFWISFLIFSIITIAAEGGNVEKETVVKALLFFVCTAAGILVIDMLVRRYFSSGRRLLFSIATIIVIAAAIAVQMFLELLLLGAYPLGQQEKLLENTAFITPWMLVALLIFIAEDSGRERLEKAKAELIYLKHQVNPHFLLNTHNNINFLIEQDPALASATLLKLSGIMQYMLYECSADQVLLEKEFRNLEQYIELEKIRQNDNMRIEYNLHYPEQNHTIAPLLLLPFVENAFKHVSHFRDRDNYIKVDGSMQNGVLHFAVVNTKWESNIGSSGGIGLKNVQQRLKLLYGRKHNLQIRNEKDLYSVNLKITIA